MPRVLIDIPKSQQHIFYISKSFGIQEVEDYIMKNKIGWTRIFCGKKKTYFHILSSTLVENKILGVKLICYVVAWIPSFW